MSEGIAGTVAALERLRGRVTSVAGEAEEYAFGARNLTVHYRRSDAVHLPRGGLDPARPELPSDHLHLLTAMESASVPIPGDLRLAPYGALVASAETDWLVLHSADTGRLLALHRPSRLALFNPGSQAPRERAEFCRPLLHWLAILDGNVVVHAGAIARDGRGLLVAGAGNAGKSTLTRVCVEAGFDVLGDNVVEVGLDPTGRVVLHAAYPTFKIRRDPAVPVPASWPRPEWDAEAQKDIYFRGGSGGARTALHTASLILDPAGPPDVAPLPPARAFFLVAPNTVAQFPFFEDEVLKRAGSTVARVPAFTAGRMPLERMAERMASLLAVGAQQ